MKKILLKFHPKDFVAALVVIFILIFKLKGFDGELDAMMALIIGYYFAHRKDGDDKGV